MDNNWDLEARGLMLWDETSRTVDFYGNTYDLKFAKLKPEKYEERLVKEIDDHTIKLTIEDPNGLV